MLLGTQEPRLSSLPAGFDPVASQDRFDDVLDVAGLVDLELDRWEQIAVEGSTRVDASGKWSAFEVAVQANRQNGKGVILEARQLAGLFVWGETLQVHTSHEFRTSQAHFARLLELIEGSALDQYVKRIRRADGEEAIEAKNGCALRFMARALKSGRGLTGDVVYLDEAFALKQAMMASLLPTMAARSVTGNPQVWYTSSAGSPDSEVLENVRDRGLSDDPGRLAYMEWSVPEDADPDDPAVWAAANPGFGIRISEDFIRSERGALDDEKFKRERLGIWAKVGGESVFPAGHFETLADEKSTPGGRLFFAVDVSPKRDSASIALVSPLDDGRVHAEIIENRVGTSWVGSRLKELKDKWSPVAIVAIAGSNAESLLPTWKRDGVRVKLVRFTQYKAACGLIYDLIVQGGLVHLGDPLLEAAVDGAKQSWTQDDASWYWSRKKSDVDITPLVALTVALAGMDKKQSTKSSRSRVVVLS